MKSEPILHFLQLCLVNFKTDPRPNRIRKALLSEPNVEITSWYPRKHRLKIFSPVSRLQNKLTELFVFISLKLKLIRFSKYILENLWQPTFKSVPEFNGNQIVIIHDIELLPIAVRQKYNHPIYLIFDMREYYIDQNNDNFYSRFIRKYLRKSLLNIYSEHVDEYITVSSGLQKLYENNFNIKSSILFSAPLLQKDDHKPAQKITSPLKIVHHGVANRNRKIEKMIEVIGQVSREVIFDIYLTGDKNYIAELSRLVKKNTQNNTRIMPPVKLHDIIPMLRNYDIGFFYVEPTTLNLLHCLPNKLFEFIHAGLCVIVGPSPDMAKIVQNYRVGYSSKEFTITSMAHLIDHISYEKLQLAKVNSLEVASVLNFSTQFEPFIDRWKMVVHNQSSMVEK